MAIIKTKKSPSQSAWVLQVGLPTVLIGVGLVALVIYLDRQFCQTTKEPSVPLAYELTGSPNWVAGRTWEARDPDNQRLLAQSLTNGQLLLTDYPPTFILEHPDWQAKYLLEAKPDPNCQAQAETMTSEQLVTCAEQHRQTVTLDHDLDDWLGQWRDNILLRDWEHLAPLTKDATGGALNQNLDHWLSELLTQGYTPSGLDIYPKLDTISETKAEVLLFWWLKHQDGQQSLQPTTLTLEHIPGEAWVWSYSEEVLPKVN